MIIDAHAHLGECQVFGAKVTEEQLIGVMQTNNITASIVQPFPGASNAPALHDEIYALSQKYAHRIFGMVHLNPHIGKDKYRKEALRCVKELGFVALKIHPLGHAVPLLSEKAEMVCECANDLGVPVMIHTGSGAPFALPSLAIPLARRYPKLNIILAHAGFAIYTGEAYVAAKECDNIFLETSWCPSEDTGWLVDSIGAHRTMFGSDLPVNLPVEIAKYQALKLQEAQLQQCLFKTAKEVFQLRL